jgi:N-acetylmuramoyl-L-alanine amidase
VCTTYHLLGMGRFMQLVTVVACLLAAGCGSTQTTSTEAATAVVRAPASTSSNPAVPPPAPRHRRRRASARAGAKPPLAGKVVGIDPGHNGRNYTDPSYLNHLIWNGREEEGCDTTGTETDGGYTEARFNWNVARYLTADLKAEGAKVVLTRHSNDGIGPCVNTRAQIINRAHANVAIDIHADGGPPGGRGVAVLLPVADGPNDHVIGASKRFGRILLTRYRALTGMPDSTYDGVDGFQPRDDLAGLNLTTVPKVLIECGNMRNVTDAAMLVRSSFQRLTARAFAQAITEFLTHTRS